MFHAVVAATFNDLQESGDVAVHIGMRILNGIAHPRLRGQVHHALEFFRAEQCRHCLAIRNILLHEPKARIASQNIQARILQLVIVIVIEIIETDDFVASLEQQARRMKADKTGCAGHEQFHNLRHTVLPEEALSSKARMCSWAAASSSLAPTTTIRMSANERSGAACRARLRTVSDSALNIRLPCPPVIARYTSARMRASSSAP